MAKFTDRIKEWWRLPEEMERDYDEESEETEKRTESRRSGLSGRRTSRERASSRRKYDDYRESDYDNNDYYASSYERSYDNDNDSYYDYGSSTERNYSSGREYQSEDYRSGRGEYQSGDYRRYENGEGSDGKVLNIAATTRLKVVCVKPKVYDDDIKGIADQIVDGYTVLINLEETPKDAIIRIIDFVSGCAYVRRGNVQRIARNIFIVTPNNVELKGDSLIGELESNGFIFME
ncbi:MAG: cell division protein SepF [Clostridia bacterium]|nr:cell division protein SepF [Clostridia bacterium]